MVYNSGFPASYPQIYSQYQQAGAQMSLPQQNSPFIWIQGGIAGAQSYQVAPNNTVVLWDSEQQTIFIKSADMQGKPSMRILDYTIRSEAPKTAQNALSGTNTQTPTREDLNALQSQIDSLKQQIERMNNEPTVQPVSKPKQRKQPDADVSAV